MRYTDYAADNPNSETLTKCAYCGQLFDDSREGHIDEATDLAFCDAPCEMHYAQLVGLPDAYSLPESESEG